MLGESLKAPEKGNMIWVIELGFRMINLEGGCGEIHCKEVASKEVRTGEDGCTAGRSKEKLQEGEDNGVVSDSFLTHCFWRSDGRDLPPPEGLSQKSGQ